MNFLEVFALAVLLFNLSKYEEHKWEKQQKNVVVLHYERCQYSPYTYKLDDDMLKYFPGKK